MATAGSGKLTQRGGGERRSQAGIDPSEVGTALREARERLGASLAEVRDRTGISWQHLEALENMDLGRLPDQRTVVTAARRYSEVVGLDPSEVCGTVLRAWQDEHWMQSAIAMPPHSQELPAQRSGRGRRARAPQHAQGPQPPGVAADALTGQSAQATESTQSTRATPSGTKRRASKARAEAPAANGAAPTDTATGAPTDTATSAQPHLRAFTQTAEVPMLGGAVPHRPNPKAIHFAETGALPVTSRLYGGRRLPPRWLRASIALTALLLLVGIAGLAIYHYKPQWLADIHVLRGEALSSVTHTTTGSSTPGSQGHSSQQTSAAGSHGSSRGSTSTSNARSHAFVTVTGLTSDSGTVAVHAKGYGVTVTLQRPCWLDVTTPTGGASPVFEGVLPAGTTKTFEPSNGQLSLEFGASGVTVAVEATGKTTPGWTFSPPSAPYTLVLTQAS